MKQKYRKIGEFIRLVDERNTGLKVKKLLGLSISKQFIPSVANIIGTDMENYKIIRKNQFACSTMQVRRDKKMPVALLQEMDEAIISQAYPVFEVIDTSVLLPEYLMMWFSRQEFDREACFYAIGGVRGSLEWDDFHDMTLPVPSIEKQREIVKEYNVITDRIALNNRLIQKLEETAQAIYKQWFVDFEFPDVNGKPYKSNGGEMVENLELEKEIPVGWEMTTLRNIISVIDNRGKTPPCVKIETKYPLIEIGAIRNNGRIIDFTKCEKYVEQNTYENWFRSGHPKKKDILFSTVGSLAEMKIFWNQTGSIAQNIVVFRCKGNIGFYLYQTLINSKNDLVSYEIGSVQASLKVSQVIDFKILFPSPFVIEKFENYLEIITNQIAVQSEENQKLIDIKDIILTKLATIEF